MSNISPPFDSHSPSARLGSVQLHSYLLVASLLILITAALLSVAKQPDLSSVVSVVNAETTSDHPVLGVDDLRGSGTGSYDSEVVAGHTGRWTEIYPSTALTFTVNSPAVSSSSLQLKELITEVTVTLPQPLAAATGSFCTWGGCLLSPRLYHEPLTGDLTSVGWTDSSDEGHVSVISGGVIERTFDFGARSLRGLALHTDGTFAVLLWDSDAKTMWLSKRDEDGGEIWSTNLNSDIAVADFWLGGSRLSYGNGLYAAYFTVIGVSGGSTGHYGDQLTYVNDDGDIQPGGWNWGCSHSMAQLVGYHPDLTQFLPVCSSDCYPDKGIIANGHQVYMADGNCGGNVSAQLGQIALGVGTWKLVFNALDKPCCDGHGIALATVDGTYAGSFTWLTDTDGAYERDPVIAHLGTDVHLERYLVGWTTTDDQAYWLAVIDGEGNFLAGPEDVTSAGVRWGNRDDSFRTRPDGSVSWVQGDPTSTELHLFRFDASVFVPRAWVFLPLVMKDH